MSEEKLFSLRVIPSTGAPEDKRHYATLAEAIEDYKQIQEHTDHSVLSLLFKESVLAEGKELLGLSDDWDWLIPERNDRKFIIDARDPGTKERTPMTREKFDAALDSYEDSGLWDAYDVSNSDLAGKDTRDFLWELTTEGFRLLPKYEPPKRECPPAKLDMSPYAIMNREVQELKAGKGAITDE